LASNCIFGFPLIGLKELANMYDSQTHTTNLAWSPINCGGIIVSNLTIGDADVKNSLEIGDRIISINGLNPSRPKDATRIMKKAPGRIDFCAERCTTTIIEAFIMKKSQDEKVAIDICSKNNTDIIISNFRVEGIATRTKLKIGDIICSINGVNPSMPLEAANIIKLAVGKVDIIVERCTTAIIRASIEKKFKDEKLGVMLMANTVSAAITRTLDNGEDFKERARLFNRFYRRKISKGFDRRVLPEPPHGNKICLD